MFVDYTGRTGLNDDSLRWTYTTTTRAARSLYGASMPHVTTFSKLRVENVVKVTKFKVENRSFTEVSDDPFHDASAPDALKAKYWSIAENMEGTSYKVNKIVSRPWQEI